MSDHSRQIERLKRIADGLRTQQTPSREPDLWCACGAPATIAVSTRRGTTFHCKDHVPEL